MSVQTGKFYMRWDGPFIVIKKLSDVNYNISHLDDNYQIVVHVNRLRKWNGDPKSLNKTIDFEKVNSTILSNINIETTVPTVTKNKNNNKNKILNENESEKESESESESEKENENEITVDIHAPNPLPTNVEEDITPTQSVETVNSETENTTTPTTNNNI